MRSMKCLTACSNSSDENRNRSVSVRAFFSRSRALESSHRRLTPLSILSTYGSIFTSVAESAAEGLTVWIKRPRSSWRVIAGVASRYTVVFISLTRAAAYKSTHRPSEVRNTANPMRSTSEPTSMAVDSDLTKRSWRSTSSPLCVAHTVAWYAPGRNSSAPTCNLSVSFPRYAKSHVISSWAPAITRLPTRSIRRSRGKPIGENPRPHRPRHESHSFKPSLTRLGSETPVLYHLCTMP